MESRRVFKYCFYFIGGLLYWHHAVVDALSLSSSPVKLSEELGCSPTLSWILSGGQSNVENYDSLFYFDPLNLATNDNFARLRESELKHGRVSMLAIHGTIFGPVVQTVLAVHQDASNQQIDRLQSFVMAMTAPIFSDQPLLFPQIQALSIVQVLQVLVVCGFLEVILLVQRDPQDMPGDYGTGYFGIRDKGRNERSLISELENGRLAMLAMLFMALRDIAIWMQLNQAPLQIFQFNPQSF